MAVTDQQKLDFLLKKIGYTKTKTGSVEGTGSISGTPKQPFAEAIPSPLIIANSSLWNEAGSIPATPPGSDTVQVKVYSTTSALRMTADATSSGQRAFIAYSAYNDTTSARLTNWIDTQFGALYLIKVYKGDPNSGGVALSAGATNENWFFDYSAGVLNFNDTNVPSGVTDTNIYIVGYRYIGQTGAPTSGISTFSYLDLTVERNLDVGIQGGISTFRNNIDLNADLDVDGHTNLDNVSIAGVTTFSDKLNVSDNVKLTVGDGDDIQIFWNGSQGFITNQGGSNLHLNSDSTLLKNAANTKSYIRAYNNSSVEIFHNNDKKFETTVSGISITGTTETQKLNVTGVSTFSGAIDANSDLDVDGHTNLDNLSVAGVSTFTGDATFSGNVSIGGTLTYEDVTNVDSVGLLTARSGIRVTGGVIEAQAGQNKIPSLYSTFSDLPSAGSYHGMFAHVHNQGRGYFAHAGNWMELVNKELDGVVGTGTERYNVGPIDAVDINVSSSTTTKSFNVTGISTFGGNLDINADIDVDGHTNLDNVSIAGVTTFGDIIEGVSGQNKIPSLYSALTDLPSANTYHGMFAHVHVTGRGYFAHAGNWLELVNKETNGTVGTGTETYNIGSLTATGIDLNGDIDVDGHTNLDNLTVAGVSTFQDDVTINRDKKLIFDRLGTEKTAIRYNDTLTLTQIRNANDPLEIGYRPAHLMWLTNRVLSTTAVGISIPKDLDVDGHTNLDNVSISGVTTTAGNVDINADLDVDGHTELDNVNIVGVTTHQGHVLPSDDITYDLGSSSKQWRNLFADNIISAPGNGFIGPDLTVRNLKATGLSTFRDIDVDGHTNLDNVSIAGVTTFSGKIGVHDGTTGSNGQYLKSIGTGVTWASFPTLRTRQTFTASAGQTTFSIAYTVNFLDVYVNGIKLTDSEFTATNGTQVVLAVGCFVGDIVELVAFSPISTGSGGGGSLNNIVEDLTPQLGGNLDLFNKTIEGTGSANITGVVTATKFVGDGSGLTGIVASGTGIIIKDSGSTVGTASTINFGNNLSVSPASAGIVTITAGVTTSQFNVNKLDVSGISTFNGNVDINADLDVDGHTNLDNVNIVGVTTFSNNVFFGDNVTLGSSNSDDVIINGKITTNLIPDVDNTVDLGASGNKWRDLYLSGTSNSSQLNISGLSTFAGNIDVNADLDVDGHTNLDNVSIAGVVTATTLKGALQATSGTFSSGVEVTNNLDVGGDLDVDGHTDLDNVSIAGVTSVGNLTSGRVVTVGSGGKLQDSNNLTFDGTSLFVSGINVTDPGTGTTVSIGANIVTGNLKATGVSTFADVDINGDLDVDGHTNLDNVTITGVTTFSSTVFANEFSGAASANNLTSGTVPAARLLGGTYSITNTGSAANIVPVNETSDTENFIVFTNAATGSQTPKTGSNLKFNASNGRLTATSFIGDGSGLTGVTAEGTGIVIKNRDATVGTAGTINFDDSLNVSALSAGITTVGLNTNHNVNNLNVLGISTFNSEVRIASSIKHLGDTTTSINFPANLNISFNTNSGERLRIGALGQIGLGPAQNYGTDGQVLTSKGSGAAVQWTTVASSVGITTNVGGSFSATAGTPSTIDTFSNYSSDDKVIEYTIYVKQGSNFQAQKLLALVDGSTIHTTQFAVVFDSTLLVQCDAIISGGNILLRVTPETGVNGSANYRVKREVM